jgi:Protein of unknown function (DUF3891)
MIVVPEEQKFRLITQPDHAHVSGEILSLWRADGLPEHPRRADLLFAAREHDNGWREADAAPRWNAERNRPHDFLTLPARERIEIWERGTCRFAAERPYAALLITRHARQLFAGRRQEEEWVPFLAFLDDFERSLIEETGISRADLEADYRWIDLADLVSLAACSGWRDPVERYGFRIEPREGALGIAPFPLAGATTFRVPCRRIPRRDYRGDADLGGELATARWGERTVRVEDL